MFEGNNIMRRNSVNGGNKYPHGQALPIQNSINYFSNDGFKARPNTRPNTRKEDHVD